MIIKITYSLSEGDNQCPNLWLDPSRIFLSLEVVFFTINWLELYILHYNRCFFHSTVFHDSDSMGLV